MTLASQAGTQAQEGAALCSRYHSKEVRGDWVLVFQPPTWCRHAGLLLSSAPHWFTPVRPPCSNHPPGSPGWLRGQGGLPSRLQGFRLNSALSRLWASTLRNCGMPSLALKSTVIFQGKDEPGGTRVCPSALGFCSRHPQRSPIKPT